MRPEFDRSAVVAWRLERGKIAVPTGPEAASLAVIGANLRRQVFRLEDAWLDLAADVVGEDRLSGWMTDEAAEQLAVLSGGLGATVGRLTVPGVPAVAVQGGVRLLGTLRSGSGGLVVTLGWPARMRGAAAAGPAGGLTSHGMGYEIPGEKCVCRRFDCGGVVPVGWCQEHGQDVSPVMDWHPGGGLRCGALAGAHRRSEAEAGRGR